VATATDRVQTGLDRTQTGADRTQTGLDRTQTGIDRAAADSDAASTHADAVQTAADRVQTGLDKTATAADRVQTGLDRTSTTSSSSSASASASTATAQVALATTQATAAAGSATTAQAQASLAAGYAASAGSAIQQDISGVTAAALHRSPNAVTAMFVYDTTKDSDPSWTEKCQHTSWYNEPLNGKWLGAAASEAAARAVSGATTGDYFQLTTDGKFYKLNVTSGTTEVFRGNKAKFPKIVGIVAESAFLTIYDLTDPGRPMWMRFVNTGAMGTGSISSLAAINGTIYVGGASGLAEIDFTHDILRFRNASGVTAQQYLATRATSARLTASGSPIVNTAVNSVAATVLPDAPVDPASGLQVPTIAVATAGGVSVIKHDGSVVNSSSTSAFTALTLSKEILSAGRADTTWYYALNPGSLAVSFALSTDTSSAAPDFNNSNTLALIQPKRSEFIRVAAAAMVQRLKNYEAAITKGLSATITNVFNTGFQVGDIRRAYLADSVVESLTATEMETNGTFTTDTSGWTPDGPAVLSVDAGRLKVLGGYGYKSYTTVVGKSYIFTADLTRFNDGGLYIGTSKGAPDIYTSGRITSSQRLSVPFVAKSTQTFVSLYAWDYGTEYCFYDNVSFKPCVIDRSYKARGADIFGSLTKALSSPSASNQLVAYSGFSASNYLQEPYSADLDFGTGEWNVSAWVNIPTANAVAGTIAERNYSSGAYFTFGITSANYLTATAYDGTTTRTVTTSAAYNTGTMLKARAVYRLDGSLSIMVNGVQVAVTYGNPLLTLNNSNAVLTIGNNYALTAPFPGSIVLLKLSATAPTPDQSVWMYEQEKHLFRDGANCLLPDSGNIVDLTYDEVTDKWVAVSAANESDWTGLIRTNVIAVPAGSNIKAAAGSGFKLNARSTTSPGVDVTIPAWNLREELVKRAEAAAKKAQPVVIFDFSGGFTATTVNGNTAITSVASLTYPAQGTLRGATVTGTGIPASTVIVAISGTTIYLSKACTASNSAVQIALSDFILPVGYETRAVLSAGALKQEGSTKDWTRTFDGFREKVTFGTAPGYSAFVEIQAVRSIL